MLDLALLESLFLLTMSGWLIVLGGAFLLSQRTVDKVSAVLLMLAGVYAILWQQPTLLGFGEHFHVALAQPVFLLLLSGAVFLWTYWLFERHVQRLEGALDDLEGALSLERTLLDVISHDLRNPLAEAHLDIQQLAQQTPQIEDRVAGIEDRIRQAGEVIENTLVYSRLASQQDAPPRSYQDITDQVERAVRNCRRGAQAAGIQVEVEAPASLIIEASPLLGRAIENLLDNAIKYGPEGSTVAITVEEGPEDITIAVGDEGPGIPPEDRERLLDRFSREPRDEDGLGLGLAIVHRLVELHGGALTIGESRMGGALVEVSLPLSPPCQGTPWGAPRASAATTRGETPSR